MELRKAWCRETAHPSYQNDWTENNLSGMKKYVNMKKFHVWEAM